MALLDGMEGRLTTSLNEVRNAVAGTASKADVLRVETSVTALRDEVRGIDGRVTLLETSDAQRSSVGSHKRRAWGVTAAIIGGCCAAMGGVGTLILALH